ncbi:hypothetical protein TWF730_009558 [Orbilia blumenaviensis]|uniref:Uncharacterized protein n=1 Tax=Orbilia blumenaviensis TaxID=1796055 RepID=A0AAV9USX4_9PEZI
METPPHPLPAGSGLLPVLKDSSGLQSLRAAIANTSDKSVYGLWVSVGETAFTSQFRRLVRQTGASDTESHPSWKSIRDTLLSEEQLYILSEHYLLREHLLPVSRQRKRWMSSKNYVSTMFLAYVAAYTQSSKIDSPLPWLRRIMVVVINGMIESSLARGVQMRIPKLVQDLTGHLTKGTAKPEEISKQLVRPMVDARFLTRELLHQYGWNYSESKTNISSQSLWHIILFAEGLEPISILRESLDQARSAATDTVVKLFLKSCQ